MRNLKLNLRKFLALAGATIVLISSAGCSKKADCDVPNRHAHRYVNEEGYTRYYDSERISYRGYERQEDYVELTKSDEHFLEFLNKSNLLRIDDNVDVIRNAQEENQDYLEYRYAYTYLQPIPIVHSNGKSTTITYIFVPQTHYSWTRDENHSRLTGETRLCHYVYTSYRIDIDEKGKYVLVPNPEQQDIISTSTEYPYICEDYYKIINLADGNEVDYEDMENDDIEHIEEPEEEKTLGKTR